MPEVTDHPPADRPWWRVYLYLVLNAVAFYLPTGVMRGRGAIPFLSGWDRFAISRVPLISLLPSVSESGVWAWLATAIVVVTVLTATVLSCRLKRSRWAVPLSVFALSLAQVLAYVAIRVGQA